MTGFLSGAELSPEIRSILNEPSCRAAVAFWGRGSDAWISNQNAKVVANLRMGGTNPFALRKVTGEVRQCDTLHAKVYIGSKHAIVVS